MGLGSIVQDGYTLLQCAQRHDNGWVGNPVDYEIARGVAQAAENVDAAAVPRPPVAVGDPAIQAAVVAPTPEAIAGHNRRKHRLDAFILKLVHSTSSYYLQFLDYIHEGPDLL